MAPSFFLTLLNFITALRSLFLGPLTIERQGRTIFTNLKKQLTQAPVRMPKLLSSCLPFHPWKGVDATATLIKITGKKRYWNFPPTVCALHAVKSVLNCRRTQHHSVCHLTCCKTLSSLYPTITHYHLNPSSLLPLPDDIPPTAYSWQTSFSLTRSSRYSFP